MNTRKTSTRILEFLGFRKNTLGTPDIGRPFPLGASFDGRSTNFALFSQQAEAVELLLFDPSANYKGAFPLNPQLHRSGDIWHIEIFQNLQNFFYLWRCTTRRQGKKSTFDVLDPYAKLVYTGVPWGVSPSRRLCQIVKPFLPYKRKAPIPLSESILYEVSLRAFSAHPESGIRGATLGTFAAFQQKIPYLKSLGITTVEFLPLAEFDENTVFFRNPSGEVLRNLWGYSTLAFFAPKAAFASTSQVLQEFRNLILALHAAEIEVILDVVFNHTSEGDSGVHSFRGIDEPTYYLKNEEGHFLNLTGCGNTLNCAHPVVQQLILECLRYWVQEFHIDGFRFDLATILARDEKGHLQHSTPLLEAIARDPLLAQTKLIAEAWDAGGGYQVGSFHPRFSEWNDRFRDDVRLFWRGDPGKTRAFALRLMGSPDLYHKNDGSPLRSINFITSHDGFTLNDLVSYQQKHNLANGESNRDGAYENFSANYGVEGATNDPQIQKIRQGKSYGLLASLLLSQGIPMLLGGDEWGRTQQGNNNAYCQDSPLSWWDWSVLETPQALRQKAWVHFLIQLRRQSPLFRQTRFMPETQAFSWFEAQGKPYFFEKETSTLGWYLHALPQEQGSEEFYVIFHNSSHSQEHFLPFASHARAYPLADSARFEIESLGKAQLWQKPSYLLSPFSVVLFRLELASSS
jgi:isoamylase